MSKEIIKTEKAMVPFAGYSQAVKAAGLVFVAGQGPFDPAGNLIGETIQEQTRQCLTNVQVILEAAGSSLDKAVSATVLMGDGSEFAGMNEEWNRWFVKDPPARQVTQLPVRPKNMKLSIAIIAEA